MPDNKYYSSTNKYGETKTTDSYGNTYYSSKNIYGGTTTTDVYGNRWETTEGPFGETVTTQTQYGYNPSSQPSWSYQASGSHYVDYEGIGKSAAKNYFTAQAHKKYQLLLWLLEIIIIILLPKKPLWLFLFLTVISALRTLLTMNGVIIGGFWGFFCAVFYYAMIGVMYHFRNTIYEEFGIRSFIPLVLFALGAVKLLILILECMDDNRLKKQIEEDTRNGYHWAGFKAEKMKEDGIRTYGQYQKLKEEEKEKKEQQKEEERRKELEEKKKIEAEYYQKLPGSWKCYMDFYTRRYDGPVLVLKQDRSGSIVYADGTEKQIEWTFEYDLTKKSHGSENKKLTVKEKDSEAVYHFVLAMYLLNGFATGIYYQGCDKGNDLYPQSARLFQREQIETQEFIEAGRPKKKDGIAQSVFAVQKSSYVNHSDLYLKGRMIYGSFEQYEMVKLDLFDSNTQKKSFQFEYIGEIEILKNGNKKTSSLISEGQEGTLVFHKIGIPYGSEEGVYQASGRNYGEEVLFSYEKDWQKNDNNNYSDGGSAEFSVEEINKDDSEQWHLKGRLRSGTISINDTVEVVTKFGDTGKARISGITAKVKKERKDLQSISAPIDKLIEVTLTDIPANIRSISVIRK